MKQEEKVISLSIVLKLGNGKTVLK